MFEFEIVNPKVDKSKPYYKDGLFIIPKVTSNYNYYLETKIFNIKYSHIFKLFLVLLFLYFSE